MTSDERVNPALHLRDTLRSWLVTGGNTTEGVRGDADARDMAFWSRHVEVVQNVEELRRLMLELELSGNDVSDLQSLLPELYRAVFAVNTPWSTGFGGAERAALSESEFKQLGLLGLSLNHRASSHRPGDAARTELSDRLSVARDLVVTAGPESLDPETRTYLLTILDDGCRAVERNRPQWEQRAAVQQAAGAMLGVAAQPVVGPAARSFRQRLGRAAMGVVVFLGVSYGDAVNSRLAELNVDQFIEELRGPGVSEIAPAPERPQLQQRVTVIVNEDGDVDVVDTDDAPGDGPHP